MGVAVAKTEMNNTVHLCSNQGCSINFILKSVHPALLSACVLAKVVVAEAELSNTEHLASCFSTAYRFRL
jgi:hypothetical protein